MTPAEKFAAAVRLMNEACQEMGIAPVTAIGLKSAYYLSEVEMRLHATPGIEVDRSGKWQKLHGVSLRYYW